MSIKTEFKSEVRAHLERLTGDLLPVITQLVTYDFPEEVAAIAFEVFYDGFTSGFPVRAFFIDSDNSEFFIFEGDEAKYPSPVDPALLVINQVYPVELEEKFSADDESFDVYTLASMELIDWFSNCWDKAGGKSFTRTAIISIHGDTKVLDLKTNVWMGDL